MIDGAAACQRKASVHQMVVMTARLASDKVKEKYEMTQLCLHLFAISETKRIRGI